jgi:iron-sulfur cluster repair protein YtfE (RIC family)
MSEIDLIGKVPGHNADFRRLVRLVEVLNNHLRIHSETEEIFFYPPIREKIKIFPLLAVNSRYLDQMDKDHIVIDTKTRLLEAQLKSDAKAHWRLAFSVVHRALMSHMKKEEDYFFPLFEHLLGTEQVADVSSKFERYRARASKT